MKKIILVVEDDKSYASSISTKLLEEDFDVSIVKDGDEAMKSARERKPDLIFLDIILPIRDGFDMLRELKSDPVLQNIPVLVVSNLGQEKDVEKARALGVVEYLVKANVSLNEVVEIIKKYSV